MGLFRPFFISECLGPEKQNLNFLAWTFILSIFCLVIPFYYLCNQLHSLLSVTDMHLYKIPNLAFTELIIFFIFPESYHSFNKHSEWLPLCFKWPPLNLWTNETKSGMQASYIKLTWIFLNYSVLLYQKHHGLFM